MVVGWCRECAGGKKGHVHSATTAGRMKNPASPEHLKSGKVEVAVAAAVAAAAALIFTLFYGARVYIAPRDTKCHAYIIRRERARAHGVTRGSISRRKRAREYFPSLTTLAVVLLHAEAREDLQKCLTFGLCVRYAIKKERVKGGKFSTLFCFFSLNGREER